MNTEDFKQSLRETPEGKLLVRYGFEPYDTESSARRVAEKAATDIELLRSTLELAAEHLDYVGYGDSWERSCAIDSKLPERISETLAKFSPSK